MRLIAMTFSVRHPQSSCLCAPPASSAVMVSSIWQMGIGPCLGDRTGGRAAPQFRNHGYMCRQKRTCSTVQSSARITRETVADKVGVPVVLRRLLNDSGLLLRAHADASTRSAFPWPQGRLTGRLLQSASRSAGDTIARHVERFGLELTGNVVPLSRRVTDSTAVSDKGSLRQLLASFWATSAGSQLFSRIRVG